MKDNNYHGESFLNRLYQDLHNSNEVMRTASLSDTKDEKVRKYLERLEIVGKIAKNNKYNGIELLKKMYYKKYVIKPSDVPESYFENQKRIALERGFGYINISDNERKQMIDSIIGDQKKSLDNWLDYFLSSDAIYPEWFKYYAFQGMLKLGSYDKEKGVFNKRTNSTTNIFIDLNREALALVYDNLCSVLNGEKVDDEVLQRLLEGGSFSKLYAYMLDKIDSSKKDIVDSNEGIWVKYNRGSNPDELVKSLEGKGTGWCTAGIGVAKSQLESGDFHVYYTKDSSGEYKQPRIAIRLEGSSIVEIRGISKEQNLEIEMEEILNKKLEEFPDRHKYKKKVKDMERLTYIYKEYKIRELTIEELRFIYEIDNEIEGFGYEKDPRIEEILKERNFKKDLVKVFNCSEDEISKDSKDVLDGKKIVYFYGDLLLDYLTNAEGLVLPDNIKGSLNLDRLSSVEGLKLPNFIGGSLYLDSLTNAEGLKLPKHIRGNLSLRLLKTAQGIKFSDSVGGYLNLGGLTNAEGLKLPEIIKGSLCLDSLESADGLILPTNVAGDLYLDRLKSAKGLVLPTNVGGDLDLKSLESAEGLTLPIMVGGYLNLRSLESVEDLILPNYIKGSLLLVNLTYAKGLKLPSNIIGDLDLAKLITTDGLIVPKGFNYGGVYSNYITMQDLIDKSLENDEKKNKQRGFSKVGVLVILNMIISIGLIFLGLIFTK